MENYLESEFNLDGEKSKKKRDIIDILNNFSKKGIGDFQNYVHRMSEQVSKIMRDSDEACMKQYGSQLNELEGSLKNVKASLDGTIDLTNQHKKEILTMSENVQGFRGDFNQRKLLTSRHYFMGVGVLLLGMLLGYLIFYKPAPKYVFHPNFIRHVAATPVLKITKENIEEIRKLPLETRSRELLAEGNYLQLSQRGFVIKNAKDTIFKFKKAEKAFSISNPIYSFKTYEYIDKLDILVQKIETEITLKAIQESQKLFLNSEIAKIGYYVQPNGNGLAPYKIIKGSGSKRNQYESIEQLVMMK